VHAHEFWLQPEKYFIKVGERLSARFMVGENFQGELWDLKTHRIEKLEVHESDGVKNLMDSLDIITGTFQTSFRSEGTRMLVMQSNSAFIELPGNKFNDYLKEDGLDDVYAAREKAKTLQAPARELYSRHSKLFVQVGDKLDDVHKNLAGLPIEIVPNKNPCSLKKGDEIRFHITFNGAALFGAKVRIWNRFDNRTTIQNIFTEKDGSVSVRISNPGAWMVSVVKMVPSADTKADWRSFWGSLVFAIK
jgi:uncharacterized GH25 family protein